MRLPNGFGAIVKMNGNRRRPYMARKTKGYHDNGSQKYFIVGYYATKEEALAALVDFNRSDAVVVDSPNLSTIYQEWLNSHKKEVTKTTVSNYHTAYSHIESIATIPIDNIKHSDIQAVIDNMLANGLNYASCKKVRSLITQLYKYARANEMTTKTANEGIKIGKHMPVRPHKPLTKQKINKLWANMDIIPLLLLYTGMRSIELRQLRKDDINLKQRIIKITKSKTMSGIRIIPIHDRLFPIIQELMKKDGTYLLGDLLTYGQLASSFRKSMKRINGNYTPHDCRHTFATMLDNAGANPISRRKLLGHANGDVTDRVYTHKSLKQLRKTINLIK